PAPPRPHRPSSRRQPAPCSPPCARWASTISGRWSDSCTVTSRSRSRRPAARATRFSRSTSTQAPVRLPAASRRPRTRTVGSATRAPARGADGTVGRAGGRGMSDAGPSIEGVADQVIADDIVPGRPGKDDTAVVLLDGPRLGCALWFLLAVIALIVGLLVGTS